MDIKTFLDKMSRIDGCEIVHIRLNSNDIIILPPNNTYFISRRFQYRYFAIDTWDKEGKNLHCNTDAYDVKHVWVSNKINYDPHCWDYIWNNTPGNVEFPNGVKYKF